MITVLALGLVATTLFGLYLASRRRPVAAACAGHPSMVASVSRRSGAAADHGVITVGVYNIHRGKGLDGRRDLNRIADTLDGVDIAGLCEVEGPLYGLRDSQADQLGRKLGLSCLFVPCQRRWLRFDRGNALLCSGKVESWYREPLVDSTGSRNRVLATVRVRVGGAGIPVLVTHLSRRVDQEVQLRTVFDRFLQFDRAILLGDFNVERTHPVLREFLDGGFGIDAIGCGLRQDDPRRIDWILTRGFRVRRALRRDAGPSDHPFFSVSLVPEPSASVAPAVTSMPVHPRPGVAAVPG